MAIDIIRLNKFILEKFNQEIEAIKKIISYLSSFSNPLFVERVRTLNVQLLKICRKDLYLSATIMLIEDYKELLSCSVK